jgi:hypothetical protein
LIASSLLSAAASTHSPAAFEQFADRNEDDDEADHLGGDDDG